MTPEKGNDDAIPVLDIEEAGDIRRSFGFAHEVARDGKERAFGPLRTHELYSDWQRLPFPLHRACRDGNRWDACQVCRRIEDILEIHGNRIALLPYLKRGSGRGRRGDERDGGERFLQIFRYDAAKRGRLAVIGIVVAGGEDVRAEYDAPARLQAKASARDFSYSSRRFLPSA